ncbi:MAG: hypothetical protein ACREVG_00695 [Burkholderiales bacterium]
MDLDKMHPNHAVLRAALTTAEAFLEATERALDAKYPGTGRGAQARAMLDAGTAHLCISIQAGSGRCEAALALVAPAFGKTLENPEMVLKASIASIFGDPEAVEIVDLGKLN